MIYEPKGKAREYSPLALNIYSGGCDHGCKYCYCPSIASGWGTTPRERNQEELERDAERASRQILLCFMGDPYCRLEMEAHATRRALGILGRHWCSVAILTKGGSRCLTDLDIFRAWPQARIKVGATLTFMDATKSAENEPGAALPADRIDALSAIHSAGVKTWASIEPVIDADESLAVISASLPYVDAYKVGKLNHRPSAVDWRSFGMRAVTMIREAGRALYVKNDLRPFFPDGFLHADECDPESLTLPDRRGVV